MGKTTLLKRLHSHLSGKKYISNYFTLEDPQLLSDLNDHPENIFDYIDKNEQGFRYLILDEIQYLNNPSNFLKYLYDQYCKSIKIIVSGSSAFYIDKQFNDSLAERKRIFTIYPFSFSEFLRAKNEDKLSNKIISTSYLHTNEKRKLLKPAKEKLMRYWQEYSVYGGYPSVVLEDDLSEKKYMLKELHQSFLKKDIQDAGIKDEPKFYALLKILASQCGELTNYNELANTLGVSHTAVRHMIYILEKSFIIRMVAPLHKNMRKELTKMPKAFMYDPGYRNALLNSFETLTNRIDGGSTLENIFFSETVKSGAEEIQFWRTQDKKEVDFIVDDKCGFEVKMHTSNFKPIKYSKFVEVYPELHLQPVGYNEDEALDVLDFSS